MQDVCDGWNVDVATLLRDDESLDMSRVAIVFSTESKRCNAAQTSGEEIWTEPSPLVPCSSLQAVFIRSEFLRGGRPEWVLRKAARQILFSSSQTKSGSKFFFWGVWVLGPTAPTLPPHPLMNTTQGTRVWPKECQRKRPSYRQSVVHI